MINKVLYARISNMTLNLALLNKCVAMVTIKVH